MDHQQRFWQKEELNKQIDELTLDTPGVFMEGRNATLQEWAPVLPAVRTGCDRRRQNGTDMFRPR